MVANNSYANPGFLDDIRTVYAKASIQLQEISLANFVAQDDSYSEIDLEEAVPF